jgi:hypothetical protein
MKHEYSSQIPPTQLVDRSYSAYAKGKEPWVRNPTNAVGGLFIPNLNVDQPQSESDRRVRLCMNNPPTALVGFEDEWRQFVFV